MISSCSECTSKCCRSGPGPYKAITVQKWLSAEVQGSDRYNKKCEAFDEDRGICTVWDRAPLICKTFVCSVRSYTKKELKKIDELWKNRNNR